MTLTKEWLQKTISQLEEERDATPGAVNEDAAKALAAMKLALASLEAEPVVPAELHPDTQKLVTDFCSALAEKLYKAQLKYGYDADWKQDGWPSQCQAHFHQHIAKGDPRDVAAYCAFMWYHGWKTEPAPAPVSVPDDVSGPLAHAYKELTPTFMRNHIDVFERYGIYPDGSAGIQAMRIALDGMNRRAAMLQGAEQTNYRAIVERIAEIIHGKVTDIDLLTVTVKSMKDKLQK